MFKVFFISRINRHLGLLPIHSPKYGSLIKLERSCHHGPHSGSSRLHAEKTTRWQRLRHLSVVRYLRSLKWTPIPIGLGFALITYQHYRHVRNREIHKYKVGDGAEGTVGRASDWEVTCYRMLPLKSLSRLFGWVNGLELPIWTRKAIIGFYIKTFGCNMDEAAERDPKRYRNLAEFFRRAIKPEMRPVDQRDCVVSPADGKVLHFGLIQDDHVEQVKGVSYSLSTFLGPKSWETYSDVANAKDFSYQSSLLQDPENNSLYHCIIYLAPGDYHCFHSPVDWEIRFRRHFSGELFSVSPAIAAWISELFSMNERVAYVGRWKYGFFSMTAVGATNVGSIHVTMDKDLSTNVRGWKKGSSHDRHFVQGPSGRGIRIRKGDHFGHFNLGSSIVLIFEAPKSYSFDLTDGQRIKFGKSLNRCLSDDININSLMAH